MQLILPIGKPRIELVIVGDTVMPRPGVICPSSTVNGWETGMVYEIKKDFTDDYPRAKIRGIVKGKEFIVWEFMDNIMYKPEKRY